MSAGFDASGFPALVLPEIASSEVEAEALIGAAKCGRDISTQLGREKAGGYAGGAVRGGRLDLGQRLHVG